MVYTPVFSIIVLGRVQLPNVVLLLLGSLLLRDAFEGNASFVRSGKCLDLILLGCVALHVVLLYSLDSQSVALSPTANQPL